MKENNKKKIKIKEDKQVLAEDEKLYASLAFIAPFQPFILLMAKLFDIYTPVVKKSLKKSTYLYLLLIGINLPIIFLFNLDVTGVLFYVVRIYILLCFIASIAILGIISYNALIIYKNKH